MSISSDCRTWPVRSWPTGGPVPARTWSRASQNYYCEKDYSANDLNMRRKAEVLQYNQKQNKWTKSQRYSYLVNHRTGFIKKEFPSDRETQLLFNAGVKIPPFPGNILCDKIIPNIPRSSKFLLVTGNKGKTIPKNPQSSSNVPLDRRNPQYLYYDKSVPLTLWKYRIQYGSQGGKNLVVNKNI